MVKKKRGRPKQLAGEWKEFFTTTAVGRDTLLRLKRIQSKKEKTIDEVIQGLLGVYDEMKKLEPNFAPMSTTELFQYMIDCRYTSMREENKKNNVR